MFNQNEFPKNVTDQLITFYQTIRQHLLNITTKYLKTFFRDIV